MAIGTFSNFLATKCFHFYTCMWVLEFKCIFSETNKFSHQNLLRILGILSTKISYTLLKSQIMDFSLIFLYFFKLAIGKKGLKQFLFRQPWNKFTHQNLWRRPVLRWWPRVLGLLFLVFNEAAETDTRTCAKNSCHHPAYHAPPVCGLFLAPDKPFHRQRRFCGNNGLLSHWHCREFPPWTRTIRGCTGNLISNTARCLKVRGSRGGGGLSGLEQLTLVEISVVVLLAPVVVLPAMMAPAVVLLVVVVEVVVWKCLY